MSPPPSANTGWLNPNLAGYAHAANITIAVLTLLALAFTVYQINESAEQGKEEVALQREIAANVSWERYMEMASSRPDFAAGLDYGTLTADRKTSYLWFVERMLFAGEQILTIDPNDRQWKLAIEVEARIHRSYIAHADFLSESYCSYTQQLRNVLINAFESSDPQLSQTLAARHKSCLAQGYIE